MRTQFDQQLVTREELENEIALGEKKPQPTLDDAIHSKHLKRKERGLFEPEGPITGRGLAQQACTAPVEMRTWGLEQCRHRNPDGTVRITDVWDGRQPRAQASDKRTADLAEGGRKATQVFDIATSLGTYRPMPIDIQLTADQWADAQRSVANRA